MAGSVPTRSVPTIMAEIKKTVGLRFDAFIQQDLNVHAKSWGRSKEPVKIILATVAEELNTFLRQRQGEIEQLGLTNEPALRADHIRNSLLMAYLEEAVRDWDVIKEVVRQREFYGGRQGTATDLLRQAEQLAAACLKRAIEAGTVKDEFKSQNITPICYFDKAGSILSAPYTDLPLVGVPITASTPDRNDLCAVLHEMGHYTYWRLSQDKSDYIEGEAAGIKDLSEDGEIVYHWREEIFADVFASLLGGPRYDQQFRDFLLSRPHRDDKNHASTVIRPDTLDDSPEWNDILNELGILNSLPNEVKDSLAQQKLHLQRLAGIIQSQLDQVNYVSILPDDLSTIPSFSVNYAYPNPKKTFKSHTGLADFEEELANWDKDATCCTWPICCGP